MFGFTLLEGLRIHFWKQAGRGMTVSQGFIFFIFCLRIYVKLMKVLGIKLREMHDMYESMSFFGAVKTLAHGSWNIVAVSELAVQFSLASGSALSDLFEIQHR